MSFPILNAAAIELRNSLRSFVGAAAMEEITVAPPAGDQDEISFLRLVSWSYVLLFEAGRVSIEYLLQLPAAGDRARDPKAAKALVHDLRTWSFHNVGFGSEREVALSRRVRRWFIETCGACPPHDNQGWSTCFLALCEEMQAVVVHCQQAMITVLQGDDDGEVATTDLRRRIDRAWSAGEFQELMGDVALRLDIEVDTRKFCERRLASWRTYLECLPEGDNLIDRLLAMMERDLLAHVEDVLPVNGREIVDAFGMDPGPDVGRALRLAQKLFRDGLRDRQAILDRLSSDQRLWRTSGP